ncbi:hypothetical protein V8F33_013675 [Rhypophila sp. PSN 637]
MALVATKSAESKAQPIVRMDSGRQNEDPATIVLIGINACRYILPFESYRLWKNMYEKICESHKVYENVPWFKYGHYRLSLPNKDIILPSVWESLVKPGWVIKLTYY